MKRTAQKVEKRTFTLKNAIPRFVSIVTRGANFVPLAGLRYADDAERFSEVEIHRIVFSKENFSKDQVDAYLKENDYDEYEIFEDETVFVVPGLEEEKFVDVAPIEYGDGVQFFVGKLKEPSESAQLAAEIAEAEIMDFSEEATVETVADVVEATEEVVEEGAENEETVAASETESSEEDKTSDSEEDKEELQEEVVVEAAEPVVEEATEEVFNVSVFREKAEAALEAFFEALQTARTESFSAPVEETNVVLFTQEEVDAQIAAAIEAYEIKKNEETIENTIDETEIVVQNSQAVQTEQNTTDSPDPSTEKFSHRLKNDLFGLRG